MNAHTKGIDLIVTFLKIILPCSLDKVYMYLCIHNVYIQSNLHSTQIACFLMDRLTQSLEHLHAGSDYPLPRVAVRN